MITGSRKPRNQAEPVQCPKCGGWTFSAIVAGKCITCRGDASARNLHWDETTVKGWRKE